MHDVHVPSHTLTVRVRDALTQAPVSDANVLLLRENEPDADEPYSDEEVSFSGHGTSDSQGLCTLHDLRPGRYFAWVYPVTPGLGYAFGEPLLLDATTPSATIDVALPAGGPVDVRVTDPEGRPLERAVVTFVDESGGEHAFGRLPYTDENGVHRAVGVRLGTYRVQAQLPGYRGAPVTFHHDPGQAAQVSVQLAPVPTK